jgi:hypothetical protein
MPEMKIGIPLHGKMAARVFHQPSFREHLSAAGFKSIYYLSPNYFRSFKFDPEQYFELHTEDYEKQYRDHALLQQLKLLRRFVVKTETTDLRFRETIEAKLFTGSIWGIVGSLTYINIFRHIPGFGKLLAGLEKQFYPTHFHEKNFRDQELSCVLAPGMGNFGYWNEGSFSLEAQRLGLPAFGAITNYDNIVNMGYRAFDPACLAVWSRQMADEAIKLHGLSASKIEITGPIQYDRFLQPLSLDRDAFLRSIHLEPSKKTILFAGGVNINHYFDLYRLFVEEKDRLWREPFNFVVRPYPHIKLLGSPAWQVLEKLLIDSGVYISNPGSIDASGDRTEEFRQDLAFEEGPDELSYLLRYCDVMVNYFSTISLEAAICDLPVIHAGYDSYTFGQRYGVTTSFLQRQTHNRRKLRLAASKVARNESELIKYVNEYLRDRTLDRDARLEYAVSECGELDGRAGVRLVNMIKSRL